ncbi:MAG: VWA domain-containing protein [Saprospirales bacterium]|nr:MAG: VWA domain-containing protein [Saprospirales bacterium]
MSKDEDSHFNRWKLILGTEADPKNDTPLSAEEKKLDKALSGIYGGSNRKGGIRKSYPKVADWLEDIRNYFPSEVVSMVQLDAIERLGLIELLTEKEVVDKIEPDIRLVSAILSLKGSLPEEAKETARIVIRKIVDKVKHLLQVQTEKAYTGYLLRQSVRKTPYKSELDWRKTILRNLKHFDRDTQSIIPEKIYSFPRNKKQNKKIIVLVDSSASMSNSLVYASIYGCVLASLPSLSTNLIMFDSEVADVSEYLDDPTDLLFGKELGGGTNISKALHYANGLIDYPDRTILFIISDLEEGYYPQRVIPAFSSLQNKGVKCICLTTLSDEGNPEYDKPMASSLAALDIPVFGCTPDQFPALLIQALSNEEAKVRGGFYRG